MLSFRFADLQCAVEFTSLLSRERIGHTAVRPFPVGYLVGIPLDYGLPIQEVAMLLGKADNHYRFTLQSWWLRQTISTNGRSRLRRAG